MFRVVRVVRQSPREILQNPPRKLLRVVPTVLRLLFPRVLPRVVDPALSVDPLLVSNPLLPLETSRLARQVSRLVLPPRLIVLSPPPLLLVNPLVLRIVPLTLLPSTPEEVATSTRRLPFALRLPVEIRMTLPVLTLKAILTRGILWCVGTTLLRRNTLRAPPLPVNRSLFRRIRILMEARPLVVAEKTRDPPAGTAAPSLTTMAPMLFTALTLSERGAILRRSSFPILLLRMLFRRVVFTVIYLLGPTFPNGPPLSNPLTVLRIVGTCAELLMSKTPLTLPTERLSLDTVR